MRLVLVRSPAAKERLLPCVSSGNYEKVRTAPVTAIVAYDREFFELLPRLYPHTDARGWFATNPALVEETGLRNSSLQGGYFLLALRAQGLDCGPMSGFDADKVDAAFFPDRRYRTNFLLNIGYGDRRTLRPRLPRLGFDEVARWGQYYPIGDFPVGTVRVTALPSRSRQSGTRGAILVFQWSLS